MKLSELLKQEKSKKTFEIQEEVRPKKISIPKIEKSKELHILTEENLLIFIKQCNKTKKCEAKHRFYNSTALEISNMFEKFIKEGKLERNRNGWIYFKNEKELIA